MQLHDACLAGRSAVLRPRMSLAAEDIRHGMHRTIPSRDCAKPLVASIGNHANSPDIVRQIVVGQVGIGHGEVAVQAPCLAP
jgi:hypothetical protein